MLVVRQHIIIDLTVTGVLICCVLSLQKLLFGRVCTLWGTIVLWEHQSRLHVCLRFQTRKIGLTLFLHLFVA